MIEVVLVWLVVLALAAIDAKYFGPDQAARLRAGSVVHLAGYSGGSTELTWRQWFAHWRCCWRKQIAANGSPYLIRTGVGTPWLTIYWHRFVGDDPCRDQHDHPWTFNLTICLRGAYLEECGVAGGDPQYVGAGSARLRVGPSPHRIRFLGSGATTLFVAGPVARRWGFFRSVAGNASRLWEPAQP